MRGGNFRGSPNKNMSAFYIAGNSHKYLQYGEHTGDARSHDPKVKQTEPNHWKYFKWAACWYSYASYLALMGFL